MTTEPTTEPTNPPSAEPAPDPIDPDRRAALLQIKLGALVRAHHPDGLADAEPSGFVGGAALRSGSVAWVLIDEEPVRAMGKALAWATRNQVAELELIVDDADAAGVVARRAARFRPTPRVWAVAGRTLTEAVPAPLPESIAPPVEALALAPLIVDAGAHVVVEHGQVKGEVLGLEIATVVVDADGARLEVGVGRHDREAFTMVHGNLPAADAVASVIGTVVRHRKAGPTEHPLRRLVPERWLRELVLADPTIVGAAHLERVEGLVPRASVKDVFPAFAAGTDADGAPVVVACSVGVDLDLVPAAADVRFAHTGSDEARLVLVLPERDAMPITRELAAALAQPAEVLGLPGDWRELAPPYP